MWQKARIVRAPNHPQIVGRVIWVKAEPPHLARMIAYDTRLPVRQRPSYNAAVEPINGKIPVIAQEYIELLAEFADDVALVNWEEFLSQGGVS